VLCIITINYDRPTSVTVAGLLCSSGTNLLHLVYVRLGELIELVTRNGTLLLLTAFVLLGKWSTFKF